MDPTDAFEGLVCTGCGDRYAPLDDGAHDRCSCGAPLEPSYDLDRAVGVPRPFEPTVSAGEGQTPLVDSPALADEIGVGRVLVKDEGANPTGSFVDRGMALAVTAAVDRGREPLALAAAGDAAQSAAAYAGVADCRSHGFVPTRSPFAVKAMTNVHGGEMRVVGGRYPDAVAALDDDLAADYHPLGAFRSPYRSEGAKAIAAEIGTAADPDVVFVPVGTGEALVGIERGFAQRVALGLSEAAPDIVAVQPSGCSTVVDAHRRGGAIDPPDHPDTIAGELEIPGPPGGALALRALDRADGTAVTVDDDDLTEGAVAATGATGVEFGLAGGAAAAAAWAAAPDLDPDATVVLLNPATGLKTPDVLRSHLLAADV